MPEDAPRDFEFRVPSLRSIIVNLPGIIDPLVTEENIKISYVAFDVDIPMHAGSQGNLVIPRAGMHLEFAAAGDDNQVVPCTRVDRRRALAVVIDIDGVVAVSGDYRI